MDVVRRRIQALLRRDAVTLAEVSRAIGRNHAYLQQFMRRGTPKVLPEEVRIALAHYFDVDETELKPSWADSVDEHTSFAGGHRRRVPKSFVARLSIARAESVFETPSSFAEAAGIDPLRYADLEEGESPPTLEELDQISRCSGKALEWLIRGETPQLSTLRDVVSPLRGSREFSDSPSVPGRRRKKGGHPER